MSVIAQSSEPSQLNVAVSPRRRTHISPIQLDPRVRFMRQGIFGKPDDELRLPATATQKPKEHKRRRQAGRSSPAQAQPPVDCRAQIGRIDLFPV
jgi:hypothetical protein